jgi:hypothetical protein
MFPPPATTLIMCGVSRSVRRTSRVVVLRATLYLLDRVRPA